jgi:hypothetical protein
MLLKWVARERITARRASVIGNLRRISIALTEFDSEYGTFPDAASGKLVKESTGSKLTLSDRTSNDVFVPLLAAGIATSEMIFDSGSLGTKRPDNLWSSDATALSHGETSFAFISIQSSSADPNEPILFGPVILGTTRLDRNTFGGAPSFSNTITR